jgi:hypothetical protein
VGCVLVGAALVTIVMGVALFPLHHAVVGSFFLLAGGTLLLVTWLLRPVFPGSTQGPDWPDD